MITDSTELITELLRKELTGLVRGLLRINIHVTYHFLLIKFKEEAAKDFQNFDLLAATSLIKLKDTEM